jgi:hypothetical protein
VATKYGSGGSWGRRQQLSRWAPVLVVGSCAPAQLLSGCLGIRKERKKNHTKRASWHGRHTSAFWQLCSALCKLLSESPDVACALVDPDGTWRAPHAHAGCQHASNSSPDARGSAHVAWRGCVLVVACCCARHPYATADARKPDDCGHHSSALSNQFTTVCEKALFTLDASKLPRLT